MMGYLRMGDFDSERKLTQSKDCGRLYNISPSQRLSQQQIRCFAAWLSVAGIDVTNHIGRPTGNALKDMADWMRHVHPADRAAVYGIARSLPGTDLGALSATMKAYPPELPSAIRMLPGRQVAAAPSGSSRPLLNLGGKAPAAAPAQVIGGLAPPMQVVSMGPAPDDDVAAGVPGGGVMTASMIPNLPSKVAGIPTMYLALGGAAAVGLYLLTRKKKA